MKIRTCFSRPPAILKPNHRRFKENQPLRQFLTLTPNDPMKSKCLATLALVFSLCAAQAALVVNGSFEAATNAATLNSIPLSPGSTNIPGWTTTNAELTWDGPLLGISPPLTAAQGSDFLDLTGNYDSPPYGGVFQTIATTPGQEYQISFEVGSDKDYDSYYTGTFEAPVVTLSLNGAAVFSATNDFPSLSDYWQVWNFAFTASATNTTIMFTGETSQRVGYIGLDNVVVTVSNAPQSSLPTTMDPVNHYAYGANIGWVDSRGDINHGAVIGEYVCSGYIYSANVGWINLGSGIPTNGIYYQNLSRDDFGVNQDGLGNLRGFAWGANIGWLNFENIGAPQVNLQTGILSGNVWSANCGWISLSNAFAYVQTHIIEPGLDSTGDGIADAWALQNFGTVNIPNGNPASNGMTLLQNYLAGTNPNNPDDVLEITSIGRGTVTPGDTTLEWMSKPSRSYAVQYSEALGHSSPWTDVADYGLGADTATFNTGHTNGSEFYRIRAFRPLIP
jgi:hypothetical protein